jgi:hypothetical protein
MEDCLIFASDPRCVLVTNQLLSLHGRELGDLPVSFSFFLYFWLSPCFQDMKEGNAYNFYCDGKTYYMHDFFFKSNHIRSISLDKITRPPSFSATTMAAPKKEMNSHHTEKRDL